MVKDGDLVRDHPPDESRPGVISPPMALLNTHIVQHYGATGQPQESRCVVRPSERVIKDMASAREHRSSWEHIYLSHPPVNGYEACMNVGDAVGEEVPEGDLGCGYYFESGKSGPLKDLMDEFQTRFFDQQRLLIIDWKTSHISLYDTVMPYGEWKEEKADQRREIERVLETVRRMFHIDHDED